MEPEVTEAKLKVNPKFQVEVTLTRREMLNHLRDPTLIQRKRLQLLAYLEEHPELVGEEIRKEININMVVSMSLYFFIIIGQISKPFLC